MDYDRMYADAISEENRAMGLVSLIVLIVTIMFFMAGILIQEPMFGIELQTMKNFLVITSIVIAIGGIAPAIFVKKQRIEF